MKLAEREDWNRLLGEYPLDVLSRMGRMLGLDARHDGIRADLVDLLTEIHMDETRARIHCGPVGENQRLALRLAADGGRGGILGKVLEDELKRLAQSRPSALIVELLTRGSLLLNTEHKSYWARPASAFSGGHQEWSLVLHPALRGAVDEVEVPGETESLTAPDATERAVTTVHQTSPAQLLALFRATGQAVDRFPQPVTQAGMLRAPVQNWLKTSPFGESCTLGLGTWLVAARALDLLRADAQFQVWACRPSMQKLETAPLGTLLRLPQALVDLAPLDVPMSSSPWAALHQRGSGLSPVAAGQKTALFDRIVRVLRKLAREPEIRERWFPDDALRPALRFLFRRWGSDTRLRYSLGHATALSQLRRSLWLFAAHALDLMAHLGMAERGQAGEQRCFRLSPLGVAVLQDNSPDGPPIPGLRWKGGDRIAVETGADAQLATLAVGVVAELVAGRRGGHELRFTDESLSHAFAAGETADDVEARLRRLLPDRAPPAALSARLRDFERRQRRVVIRESLVLLEVAGLSAEAYRRLEQAGAERFGELVVVPAGDLDEVLAVLGAVGEDPHDYDLAPRAQHRLEPDGVLWLRPGACDDLRLRNALEAWGLRPPFPPSLRLDPEAVPGFDTMPDGALIKHLIGLLRALEPFVVGGVPASVRVRVLAEAGLIDAPTVTPHTILTFSESVAQGLQDLGTLGPLAEPLSGGRFLVAQGHLALVEERLSELGIPFAAEHSSLRDKARMQATVADLRAALDGREEEEA